MIAYPSFAALLILELMTQDDIAEKKMRPWIGKKIVEIFGEEEPTLIQFILDLLRDHKAPEMFLEELSVILADEADIFVIKLWRFLIFTLLLEAKLAEKE